MNPDKNKVRRSALTMPVVTARFIENAWKRGCDFIVIDLEDSVPQHLKAHARTLVRDAITKVTRGGAEAYVRINHDFVEADLDAAVWPGLSKIKYPKTESAEEMRRLDEIITRLERERGIRPGTVGIDASIESAKGVANGYEIAAASPRVTEFGASSGGYDMSRDLGIEMFQTFEQFSYIKGEAELNARTLDLGLMRVAPFVANTDGSVSNTERALREAEAIRRCGIRLGSGGLNPAVVDSHNRGLTPSEEDVKDAHWVLEQFRQLEGSSDTWRDIDGRIIDHYEAQRARGTLEWAALCAEQDRKKAAAVARTEAALAAQPE